MNNSKKKFNLLIIGCLVISGALTGLQVSTGSPIWAIANQAVNSPSKATIASYPTKSTYLTGEMFDPTGLSLEVSCTDGSSFLLEYNADTADKFVLPTEALKKSDTNISISYASPNGTVEVSVPVSVDYYRINEADIYLNDSDRVMFSINGEYGEGYQDNVEEAEFYIVPLNDKFRFAQSNPTTTPASFGATYGSFVAELDITDIISVDAENKTATASRYWPHFVMKNEAGVAEDKDLKFPNLVEKSILAPGTTSEYYHLFLYKNVSQDKYIPTVALTGDPVPFDYYWNNADESYAVPDTIEQGYTPMYCNLEEINGRVYWSSTFRYKGFKNIYEIQRASSFYLHGYVGNKSDKVHYSKKAGGSFTTAPFHIEVDETESTFTWFMDITDLSVNYLVSGAYYAYFLRAGGDGDNPNTPDVTEKDYNDTKTANSINNNVTITLGDKKYINLNVANGTTGAYTNAWGCLGFKIEPAA